MEVPKNSSELKTSNPDVFFVFFFFSVLIAFKNTHLAFSLEKLQCSVQQARLLQCRCKKKNKMNFVFAQSHHFEFRTEAF